jgi:hypothetical protein
LDKITTAFQVIDFNNEFLSWFRNNLNILIRLIWKSQPSKQMIKLEDM